MSALIFVGGFLGGVASVALALYFVPGLISRQKSETIGGTTAPIFARKAQKKTPKSISEAELYKREQRETPLDPTGRG